MKLLSAIMLLGLLAWLGLAVATWDLQRREAAIPPLVEKPLSPSKYDSSSGRIKISIVCPACKGNKFIEVDDPAPATCGACKGSGKVSNMAGAGSVSRRFPDCPFCKGTGKVLKKIRKPCPTCNGTGLVAPGPAAVAPPASFQGMIGMRAAGGQAGGGAINENSWRPGCLCSINLLS